MIKISAADRWFSLAVRERAGWACERCGVFYPEGKRMALHCSHYIGRGNHAVRYDPDNATAACYGCHRYLSANPHIHEQYMREHLGPYRYDALIERSNDTLRGRAAKRERDGVAKHYRDEFRRMSESQERFFASWY